MQKNVLLPGDSTVVELIYNTHTYKGKVSKNAKVMTNDTTLTIDLAADVFASPDTVSKIRFTPANLAFDKATKKQIVTIQNLSDKKMELSQLTDVIDKMKMKLKDEEIDPGKTGRVEFEWKGDFPKTDLANTVTFKTALDSVPRITIPYVIKGTEMPAKPIVAKPGAQPVKSDINSNKPKTISGNQAIAKPDSGKAEQPKMMPPKATPPSGNFETPKIPSDTGNVKQVNPVQEGNTKTDK